MTAVDAAAALATAMVVPVMATDWRKVTADADSEMWIVAAVMTTTAGASMRH